MLAGFAAFVAVNGGIVVGDKGNHTPVLHGMQLPYLALFCAGALAPVHLSLPRRVCFFLLEISKPAPCLIWQCLLLSLVVATEAYPLSLGAAAWLVSHAGENKSCVAVSEGAAN